MRDDRSTVHAVPSFAGQPAWAPPPQSAGFLRRMVATFVDFYVVSLLNVGFIALGILGATLGAQASGARYLSEDLAAALAGPFLTLWVGLWWAYIGLFTYHGGQTPGKMLLRIRVIRFNGTDPSWTQALLRPAGYLISWLPFGLGLVLAAVPPAKRALHDRLMGTRVINVVRQTSHGRVRSIAGGLIALTLLAGSPSASAAVVDRILATAHDRVITLSDLAAYQTIVGPPNVSRDDAVRALIDRQLLLEEAVRFAISDPTESDVSSRISTITAQVGGPEELTDRLTRLGWEQDTLRAWVAEDLRVSEFLDQRIYFFVLVPPPDIDAYYHSHREEFRGLSPDDARDEIRNRLIREHGDEKRDQFLTRLKERAKIRINPLD